MALLKSLASLHEKSNMDSYYKEAIGKMRTKIVATLGPASSDALVLGRMIDAGADVFRLNFSHGTHDDHTAALNLVRRIGSDGERRRVLVEGERGDGRAVAPLQIVPAPGRAVRLV